MNEHNLLEEKLQTMLLSGIETTIEKALEIIYFSDDWQSFVVGSIGMTNAFFKERFPEFLALFKNWLVDSDGTAVLRKKVLKKTITKLSQQFLEEEVKDADLLKMFRKKGIGYETAMKISYQRFYDKVFAALMKSNPDSETVKEVLQDTFLKVFKRLHKTADDFSLKSNLEAYFMSSCKYAYWKYWDKKGESLEQPEIIADVTIIPIGEKDSMEERANCFEKKVFLAMGETCQKIIGGAYLGYSNPQLKELYGYTDGYVKKKKSECLKKAKVLAKELCAPF